MKYVNTTNSPNPIERNAYKSPIIFKVMKYVNTTTSPNPILRDACKLDLIGS